MSDQISRRGRPTYLPERISADRATERAREFAPERVELSAQANRVLSAFRRELRARGIDHCMARLVLCFYRRAILRPREVAVLLAISRPTASRWLDRAEASGLVDKQYGSLIDRRGTDTRLTEKGCELRRVLEKILEECRPDRQRFGVAYGLRACSKWDR